MATQVNGHAPEEWAGLDIEWIRDADTVRVRLVGDLDLCTVDQFLDTVDAFDLYPQQILVLDLTRVCFCDARGLAALAQTREAARGNGHRVSIRGASPQIRRLLAITGEEDILDSAG